MYFTSVNLWPSNKLAGLILSFCVAANAWGQPMQEHRFELTLAANEEDDFKVVSAQDNGLMVHRRIIELQMDQLEIIRIDTSLQEVWRKKIPLGKDIELVKAQVKDETLFMLFKNLSFRVADFHIAAIAVKDGEFAVYEIKNVIPFIPTEFVLSPAAAFIGGYFNYRPLIVHFNFSTFQSRILPGFFNEPGELTQIKPYDDGTTEVIVSTNNFQHKRNLWIRTYNEVGEIVKTTILQGNDKNNLIFGRSIRMEDGQQMVVGAYGRQKQYSRGIFVAQVNPQGEYTIQYHDYGDLHHFFNYLKANRERKIKSRIERKRIKGKKAKFNYRFMVHEIIQKDNQYIMLGEAFYPRYAYPNNPYGRSLPQLTNSSFAGGGYTLIGYQYTHAVVIGFNKKGTILWDNSFEINDVMTPGLEQFVKIKPVEDHIVLQYVFNDKIRTKIINGPEIIEGKSTDEIKLLFKDDVLKETKEAATKLEYWYGDHLFVYGIQQVNNFREVSVNASRRVFFINKLAFK